MTTPSPCGVSAVQGPQALVAAARRSSGLCNYTANYANRSGYEATPDQLIAVRYQLQLTPRTPCSSEDLKLRIVKFPHELTISSNYMKDSKSPTISKVGNLKRVGHAPGGTEDSDGRYSDCLLHTNPRRELIAGQDLLLGQVPFTGQSECGSEVTRVRN
ncbi:hypothetical protein J6590_004310 [Homalodisca vitripennis]|nr:hypothetical protein J6590_004310 [Homalodisca vitripennis]